MAIVAAALIFLSPTEKTRVLDCGGEKPPAFPRRCPNKNPAIPKMMAWRAIQYTDPFLQSICGARAELLAATTSIKKSFATGLLIGPICAGIEPLLLSLRNTPKIVGNTTIRNKDVDRSVKESEMPCPIRIKTVRGTTKGEQIVSRKIRLRDRAPSPLNIVFQMKPDTAVGMEKSSTKPAVYTGLSGLQIVLKTQPITGMNRWETIKNSINTLGRANTDISSRLCKSIAPDRVIKPKSRGIAGLNGKNRKGNRKPKITPRGVSKGIRFSSHWLIESIR